MGTTKPSLRCLNVVVEQHAVNKQCTDQQDADTKKNKANRNLNRSFQKTKSDYLVEAGRNHTVKRANVDDVFCELRKTQTQRTSKNNERTVGRFSWWCNLCEHFHRANIDAAGADAHYFGLFGTSMPQEAMEYNYACFAILCGGCNLRRRCPRLIRHSLSSVVCSSTIALIYPAAPVHYARRSTSAL